MSESIIPGIPGCERCEKLRDEVKFWREQQKLAANVAATLADLNDYDGRLTATRSLLARERDRRKDAERQVTVLEYRLAQLTGTEA